MVPALFSRAGVASALKEQLLTGAFLFYRFLIHPILKALGHSGCRFIPTCSCYAEHLLREEISIRNIYKVFIRILRCNPWSTKVLTFDPPTLNYAFVTNNNRRKSHEA